MSRPTGDSSTFSSVTKYSDPGDFVQRTSVCAAEKSGRGPPGPPNVSVGMVSVDDTIRAPVGRPGTTVRADRSRPFTEPSSVNTSPSRTISPVPLYW